MHLSNEMKINNRSFSPSKMINNTYLKYLTAWVHNEDERVWWLKLKFAQSRIIAILKREF